MSHTIAVLRGGSMTLRGHVATRSSKGVKRRRERLDGRPDGRLPHGQMLLDRYAASDVKRPDENPARFVPKIDDVFPLALRLPGSR